MTNKIIKTINQNRQVKSAINPKARQRSENVISTQNININKTNAKRAYIQYENDSFVLGHVTLCRLRSSLNFEADCSDNGNHGTWNGSDIDGAQYGGFTFNGVSGEWEIDTSPNPVRLSYGSFNGTDNYIDVTGSVTSARVVSFAIYPQSNNFDISQLSATAKISINSSNEITTTGLSGVTVYVGTTAASTIVQNQWNRVFVEFDAHTCDDIEVGRGTTYTDGLIDEFCIFDDILSSDDRTDIIANKFDDNHAQYSNCKLWLSMDNPKTEDRSTEWTVVSGSYVTPAADSIYTPTDIFDWTGDNFKDGDKSVWVTSAKSLFDLVVSVVDNGN